MIMGRTVCACMCVYVRACVCVCVCLSPKKNPQTVSQHPSPNMSQSLSGEEGIPVQACVPGKLSHAFTHVHSLA